jgi:aminopeptidase N
MFKYFITIIFMLCSKIFFAQADPIHSIDVENYTYKIEVSNENDIIQGSATITGKGAGYGNNLQLNLKNLDKAKRGMVVLSVKNNKNKSLLYTHKNDVLNIQLPKANFFDFKITITYKGIPINGLVIGKNKFGNRTWFGDNWPNRAQYWLPCVDNPADKATITWGVLAPKEYTVVANGMLVGKSAENSKMNFWKFYESNPIPTKVAVIGIAKLEKKCSTWKDSLQVCNYFYPETFAMQPTKMDVANEILTFFDKTIGTYPFTKLNNVQSTTMFGGMENANNIFYDENAIDSEESNEALIAHEIAHQWFGNTVTEKDFSHLWLSEGFATFFTNYYFEKKYGVDTFQKRVSADYKKVANFLKNNKKPVVDNSANYMSLLNANSYEKGGLFLQALRKKIGDDIFFKGIRNYFATYKYKNANTDDFRNVMEQVYGKDLKEIFTKWLYEPNLPEM